MTDNFENINHLVLNFYPDGYSIAVKLNEFPVFTSETILETAKISYEETSLLDYIENEELPPLLVDMIESSPKLSQYKIWHKGCLILEVRDKINLESDGSHSIATNKTNYNQDNTFAHNAAKDSRTNHQTNTLINGTSSWPNQNDKLDDLDNAQDFLTSAPKQATQRGSFFILLKPTNLSMLYDVLNLTGSNCWTNQDRLQLESQIVLHSSPRLHLELDAPDPLATESHDLPTRDSKEDSSAASTTSDKCLKISKFSRTRLKSIYSKRTKCVKTNGGNNGNGNSTRNNINNHHHHHQTTTVTTPPELTLQQFLATKRAKRNTTTPLGHMPRFQRFRKHFK